MNRDHLHPFHATDGSKPGMKVASLRRIPGFDRQGQPPPHGIPHRDRRVRDQSRQGSPSLVRFTRQPNQDPTNDWVLGRMALGSSLQRIGRAIPMRSQKRIALPGCIHRLCGRSSVHAQHPTGLTRTLRLTPVKHSGIGRWPRNSLSISADFQPNPQSYSISPLANSPSVVYRQGRMHGMKRWAWSAINRSPSAPAGSGTLQAGFALQPSAPCVPSCFPDAITSRRPPFSQTQTSESACNSQPPNRIIPPNLA